MDADGEDLVSAATLRKGMTTVELTLAVVLLLGLCLTANAAVATKPIEYGCGDVTLEGYLAYDDSTPAKRPGVLVIHEWWGLNDYAKDRARELAQMGYVAFAADMYGKGVVTSDPAEAGKLAGQFRGNWDSGGRKLMRDRAQAALSLLAKQPLVDPKHLAAIGYCFGGTTALELAYSGAPLAGAVSFHGGLTVPDEADLPNIRARALILHGADDLSVKPETITALQSALRKGHVDWQMIYYGGAVHGFTNPANVGATGGMVAYDAKAARHSWEAMRAFFDEVLRGR
jgi:dienelactone hydrolase